MQYNETQVKLLVIGDWDLGSALRPRLEATKCPGNLGVHRVNCV